MVTILPSTRAAVLSASTWSLVHCFIRCSAMTFMLVLFLHMSSLLQTSQRLHFFKVEPLLGGGPTAEWRLQAEAS